MTAPYKIQQHIGWQTAQNLYSIRRNYSSDKSAYFFAPFTIIKKDYALIRYRHKKTTLTG